MPFASGKNAYGISDRSGFRYKLNRMRKEWNGSLVGFDEFEPKQPQLFPIPRVDDPQALKNARPDRKEPFLVFVGIPTVENPDNLPVVGFTQVGQVTVVIT